MLAWYTKFLLLKRAKIWVLRVIIWPWLLQKSLLVLCWGFAFVVPLLDLVRIAHHSKSIPLYLVLPFEDGYDVENRMVGYQLSFKELSIASHDMHKGGQDISLIPMETSGNWRDVGGNREWDVSRKQCEPMLRSGW